ncbi:jouberin [Diachasma alloeum]|uniref:jouberin n=1 Tax=Diachasma alloeum TaxID=454923 RepID=UPI00073825A6|nr:jouberin [Diachasma alloeum]
MLRKSRNPSEEDEESTRRGKLSEFSNKVERMFRAAFKKDSNISSQSKQPQKSVDSDIEEAPKIEAVFSPMRKTQISVEKSQNLDSSDVSSDLDTGSRTNLVKIDKISKLSEEKNEKEKQQSKSTTRKRHQLKRSQHVHSNELEPNSMDVVVDIHCENPNKNDKDNANMTEEETIESLSETELDKSPIKDDSKVHEQDSFVNSVDSVKKQRKRWSKEASVIKLPSRTSFSSTSARSSPWRSLHDEDTVVPVLAPRINKIINLQEEDSDAGLDNAAFESDHDDDQVLRIETSHGVTEQTKIEMRSVENTTDSLDSSPQILKSKITQITKFTKLYRKSSSQSEGSKVEDIIEQMPRRVKSFVSENPSIDHSEDSLLSKKRQKKAKSKARTRTERNDKKSSRSSESGDYNQTGDSERLLSDLPGSRKPPRRAKRETQGEEQVSSEEVESTPKIRKIKQKRESLSTTRYSEDTILSNKEKSSKKLKKPKKKKEKKEEMKFTSVKIHKADMLEADYVTRHPMVIVHIVEANTGDYLKLEGSEISRRPFLQPLITGTFDFKENKSMVPYWDEELIFELDFEILMGTEKDQVLVLFEVVDLLSFAEASQNYDQFGAENCWYKIAWAFLKPVGRERRCHLNKQVRLQLYKPKRLMRKTIRHKCEAFSWWKSGAREKYPSSLYTTITSVSPPKLEPVFYGQLVNDLPSPPFPQKSPHTPEPIHLPKWSRLAAQSCKIPNDFHFQTEIAENGSFYVLFSNNGMYLASVNSEEYDYPIIIHKVDEMKIFIRFTGHKSFVYSLDWSQNDDYLLSVSSDQTARVWDVKNRLIHHIFMLPHPSYIYSGKFHPSLHSQMIATGCYDHFVRIWERSSLSYELLQELEGHEGFINSMCFQKNGSLLTADSIGVIIHWAIRKSRKKMNKDWGIFRKIKIKEVEGVPINTIVLHPLGSRLLVHSRNNGLRMLDLATGVVLQKYEGLKSLRIQTTARISPCGGLLLCGGEDGVLNVWSVESGKKVAVYHTQPKNLPVTCVDYHPYDHVLVYSTFGAPSGAVVLRFDKNPGGEGVGLKMLNEDGDLSVKSGSVIGNKLNSSRRFSEETLRSQKNYVMRAESSENARDTSNGSREDLRKRLKIFNETEGELKTKSANRLTNIIAKIDRILSNSSKSNYDVEANRLGVPMEEVSRVIPYVPPLFSTFEDNSSESKSSEIFEMMSLNRKNFEKSKSKSARIETTFRTSEEEVGRAFSDGIVNCRGRIRGTREPWNTGNYRIDKERQDKEERRESSGDSGETYVVEIDENREEMRVESQSSVRSDATFVVENEKIKPPVPKPRRRSGLINDIN